MLKTKSFLLMLCTAFAITACDSDTLTLGGSLIGDMDHLTVGTATFDLSSRSIQSDAVLARNTMNYLGTVKDPETGEYISANLMTQFHILEDYEFPAEKLILSRDEDGNIIADDCELRLFYNGYYGDSLSLMKLTAYELDHPMNESTTYYSDFDPKANGFVREDGLQVNHAYTLTDLTVSETERNSSDFTPNICISLNKPYTDKNGKTYNNYGSYVMAKYYENPSYFKNSITLANNVMPGFYVESTGGLGSMAYIPICQLNVRFRYTQENKDTTLIGVSTYSGTPEVMQYTRYINDNNRLQELVNDGSCTYLKTPSGIFTEIAFPVEEMLAGHENDTINSAKFALQCLNNKVESNYSFTAPKTVMLIPTDSLGTFFEHKNIINNKTSYTATYDSSKNSYVFSNVSSLIKAMDHAKRNGETSPNWNKAVVVPVTISYSTEGYVSKVVHDMSLTSVRLAGGADNPQGAIKISIIFSKYQ